MRTRQRLSARRVIVHEGRVHQGRLNNLTEELGHQLLSVPLRVDVNLVLFSDLTQNRSVSLGGDLNAHSLRQARVHANPLPLTEQVNGAVLGLDTLGTDSLRAALDDLLHALSHHKLVSVGFVALQGGELGAVGRVHALVTEHAANLVHALNTTNHCTLERQLGRNTHGHRLVKSVQVSAERASRRATVHQLQNGSLNLNVAVILQHAADGAGNQGALLHQLASLLANHQVQVTLANAGFLVQVLVQNRHGAQRLRRHLPVGHHNGQLATARNNHAAGHEHVVTQVNQGLPLRQGLLAHLSQRQHRLDTLTLGTTLQGRKAQLTGVTDEHHAATNMHHTVSLVASLQLLSSQLRIVLGAQILNVVGLHAVTLRIQQTHRVCLATRLDQLRTLFQANLHLLGHISNRRCGSVLSAHSDTYLCSVLGTLLNERTLSAGPCCQSGGSGQRTQQPVPALAPTPQSAHRKSSGRPVPGSQGVHPEWS